jgi:hypothetical protein
MAGWSRKYPLISITRSVEFVANTLIPPSDPLGTIAEFPTIPPADALTVAVPGHGWSSGHADKNPTAIPGGGTTTR